MIKRLLAALCLPALLGAGPAFASERVLALDQCADQYVMALVPRGAIVGVTPRADDQDSWLKDRADGLPVRRPTLEAALAADPTVAVRYWGGDQRLVRALQQRGVRIVQIEDATSFDEVRSVVRSVARGVGQVSTGEILVHRMDGDLSAAAGAWRGRRALYMTPSGFTAGPGTLTDAVLAAAGLSNTVSSRGFSSLSLERLVLSPPQLVVKAFFEATRSDRRGAGRSRVMSGLAEGRIAAEIPGALLTCPAWFSSEASRRLASRAPR